MWWHKLNVTVPGSCQQYCTLWSELTFEYHTLKYKPKECTKKNTSCFVLHTYSWQFSIQHWKLRLYQYCCICIVVQTKRWTEEYHSCCFFTCTSHKHHCTCIWVFVFKWNLCKIIRNSMRLHVHLYSM